MARVSTGRKGKLFEVKEMVSLKMQRGESAECFWKII